MADLIEEGVVTGIQSSGVRGRIGEAISHGKLKNPAIIRSHGGRVRAIEEGDVHIDIAFIGAPTSDEYGNARAVGGKSDCGVLSYSMVDAKYADNVVVITDCLVPAPNYPPSISMVDVDYVCVVVRLASGQDCQQRSPHDERCPGTDDGAVLYSDHCKISVF